MVSPGFTHSEMVDPYIEAMPDLIDTAVSRHSASGRVGDPSEVAAAITWLCSDAASFVNGAVIPVDGGDASKLYGDSSCSVAWQWQQWLPNWH